MTPAVKAYNVSSRPPERYRVNAWTTYKGSAKPSRFMKNDESRRSNLRTVLIKVLLPDLSENYMNKQYLSFKIKLTRNR